MFEKTLVYCSEDGKAEEQKIPTFEIVTIDERYPAEPDNVQEAKEASENYWTSSLSGPCWTS